MQHFNRACFHTEAGKAGGMEIFLEFQPLTLITYEPEEKNMNTTNPHLRN